MFTKRLNEYGGRLRTMTPVPLRQQTQHNFFCYDFRRNVNKRVVSWVSDGEKTI